MYAVFIDDGFDSVFEYKEAAKEYAKSVRDNGQHAFIKRLTKQEIDDLNI